MSNRKIKVGVIGVGHVGKEHARIYARSERAELVGLCDIDPSKKAKAEELGTEFFSSHGEMLDRVEALSIAVPSSLHYPIAKEALSHGIHTLVEKPITLKLEEADELLEIARKRRRLLEVGHIERHNVGLRALRELLRQPRFIEIHRLGPFTGRINDCGVILDLMIHDLDILLSLVPSPIATFDAIGVNVLTPFEDIANARIKFADGTIADLTASRLTPETQRKMRIFQENAYISLDYSAQVLHRFRKDGLKIIRDEIPINKEEPLRNEIESFLRKVEEEKDWGEPDVAAREALALALEIVEEIAVNQNKLTPK